MPISEDSAYMILASTPALKTKYTNVNQLIAISQDYPLKRLDFCILHEIVANNFHNNVVNKWQDNIIKFVKKTILDNF